MLSRISLLRSQVVSSSFLAKKLGFLIDNPWSYNLVSDRCISTVGSECILGNAYAPYSIFKGKAALVMTPLSPTISEIRPGLQIIDKKGVILLKFIPAIGQRKYDSTKKQYFALSVTEIGCLISLGTNESCEFFHDPSKQSSLEGQVKKTLSISPLNDGSGYMFSLSVADSVQNINERFSVPVTKAEFSVMRSAFGFVLPYIMGWGRVIGSDVEHVGHGLPTKNEVKIDPYLEWEK